MEERNKIIIETIEKERKMLAEITEFQSKLKQNYCDKVINSLSNQEKIKIAEMEMGCLQLIGEIKTIIKHLENEVGK